MTPEYWHAKVGNVQAQVSFLLENSRILVQIRHVLRHFSAQEGRYQPSKFEKWNEFWIKILQRTVSFFFFVCFCLDWE